MRKQIVSTMGLAAFAVAAISGGAVWLDTPTAIASDHSEAPAVQADVTMDLTDLYVFGSAEGKTTLIACWDGFDVDGEAPFAQGPYNEDALYTFHIDNSGPDGELDGVADIEIYWRYGTDQEGNVGIKWEGIPGADAAVIGAIEETFEAGDGTSVWTGMADDPFFFDVAGYLNILQDGSLFDENGDLQFDNTRDFLEGYNVKAAAIEIDTELLQDADAPGPIQVWITSGTL